MLLDNFQTQPQLVELQQDAGELNRNRKQNILRSAVNPVSSSKQTVELYGEHASVQAHAPIVSIYVNLEANQDSAGQSPARPQETEQPWDRFHIVRTQLKNGKRIIGDIKINPLGKVSQEQNLVPTTAQRLTGGWVRVSPNAPLDKGEYAVVELLGKEGMNTYVWDFGVNPNAPANAAVLKPEPVPVRSDRPDPLKTKRQ